MSVTTTVPKHISPSRRYKQKQKNKQAQAKRRKAGQSKFDYQLLNKSNMKEGGRNPVKQKVRAIAGSVLASVSRRQGNVFQKRTAGVGKRRNSLSRERRNSIPALRRSLSRESVVGSHSDPGKGKRLHQCLKKRKGKKRTEQISQSSNFNCLVIPNEAVSISPSRTHGVSQMSRQRIMNNQNHKRNSSAQREESEVSFSPKRKRVKQSGIPQQDTSEVAYSGQRTLMSSLYRPSVLSNQFTSDQVMFVSQEEAVPAGWKNHQTRENAEETEQDQAYFVEQIKCGEERQEYSG